MISMLRLLLAGMSLFGLVSCAAYFKRKECERTDWRQHGHNVAMSGQRLDADPLIRECQKVEGHVSFTDADLGFKAGMAKYCSLDQVYQEGKLGKDFNFSMCDGLSEKAMRQRHGEGLRLFCKAGNGYNVGASGEVYRNQCPKELETAFLGEYRRGRKVYLTTLINEKERQIDEIDNTIRDRRFERDRKSSELIRLSSVNATRVVQRERKFDAVTNTYKEEERAIEDPAIVQRRESLGDEIRDIENQISSSERQKQSIQNEVRRLRQEVVAL